MDLKQALVLEYYSNPGITKEGDESAYGTLDVYKEGSAKCEDSDYLDKMPRNSIVGIIKGEKKPRVFYPFFSHMFLPIKPGEHVWVFQSGDSSLGFWMSRVVADYSVDDLNYTHLPRNASKDGSTNAQEQFGDTNTQPDTTSKEDLPHFSDNDGGNANARSYPGGDEAYALAKKDSSSFNGQFVGEPVVRPSKRSPDLALYGSNNTTVVLGQDRTGDAYELSDEASGAIDIATGLGQTDSTYAVSSQASGTETNLRSDTHGVGGWNEIMKNSTAWSKKENKAEGDPDFINDLSRVHVSMKSKIDDTLAGSDGYAFPDTASGTKVESVDGDSGDAYILLKSNNNRIVSRKDGSVRIIKEGTEDSDRATITMEKDGTIMIDGPKIVIGSGVESGNGEGSQVFLGRDATESIVLGNELHDLLNKFFTDLKTHLSSIFDTHIHPTPAGATGPTPNVSTVMQAACDSALADLINTLSKNGKTK